MLLPISLSLDWNNITKNIATITNNETILPLFFIIKFPFQNKHYFIRLSPLFPQTTNTFIYYQYSHSFSTSFAIVTKQFYCYLLLEYNVLIPVSIQNVRGFFFVLYMQNCYQTLYKIIIK